MRGNLHVHGVHYPQLRVLREAPHGDGTRYSDVAERRVCPLGPFDKAVAPVFVAQLPPFLPSVTHTSESRSDRLATRAGQERRQQQRLQR